MGVVSYPFVREVALVVTHISGICIKALIRSVIDDNRGVLRVRHVFSSCQCHNFLEFLIAECVILALNYIKSVLFEEGTSDVMLRT